MLFEAGFNAKGAFLYARLTITHIRGCALNYARVILESVNLPAYFHSNYMANHTGETTWC